MAEKWSVDFVGLECHLGTGATLLSALISSDRASQFVLNILRNMFLSLLVDLLSCQRFTSDTLMECPPSTPWMKPLALALAQGQPKLKAIPPAKEPGEPQQPFERVCNALCWEPELDKDDGYGYDDPRLPELII